MGLTTHLNPHKAWCLLSILFTLGYFFFCSSVFADSKKVALILNYGLQTETPSEAPYGQTHTVIKVQTKQQFLDELSKLVSGPSALGANDQLMISILSHGAKGGLKQQHEIVLSDGTLNMVEISSQIQKLLIRNVKIGLQDFSCFSDASLTLKNTLQNTTNLCVVTGDSSGATSELPFVNAFLTQIEPGKSLEDVFLSARMAEINRSDGWFMSDTPGISTYADSKAKGILNELRKIFALGNWIDFDLELDPTETECNRQQVNRFLLVERLARDLSTIFGAAYLNEEPMKSLSSHLTFYDTDMNEQFKKYPGLKESKNKKEFIDGQVMSWLELANYYDSPEYQQFNSQRINIAFKSNPPVDFFNLESPQSAIDLIQSSKLNSEDKQWLLQNLPHQIHIKNRVNELDKDINFRRLLFPNALELPNAIIPKGLLSMDERILYNDLYEFFRKEGQRNPNACREIKF